MNHLTEIQINEYLDAILDADARRQADAHLAACPGCRGKLDELRNLFAALESVPDQALARDLTPGVLRRLNDRGERSPWRVILPAQAALAFVLLVWLLAALPVSPISWLHAIGDFDPGRLTRPLAEAWAAVNAWQAALPARTAPSFQPGAAVWAALGLAGLAFVMGNLLFLRGNGKEARK
jgi:anti-sigma factor RsiW